MEEGEKQADTNLNSPIAEDNLSHAPNLLTKQTTKSRMQNTPHLKVSNMGAGGDLNVKLGNEPESEPPYLFSK